MFNCFHIGFTKSTIYVCCFYCFVPVIVYHSLESRPFSINIPVAVRFFPDDYLGLSAALCFHLCSSHIRKYTLTSGSWPMSDCIAPIHARFTQGSRVTRSYDFLQECSVCDGIPGPDSVAKSTGVVVATILAKRMCTYLFIFSLYGLYSKQKILRRLSNETAQKESLKHLDCRIGKLHTKQ